MRDLDLGLRQCEMLKGRRRLLRTLWHACAGFCLLPLALLALMISYKQNSGVPPKIEASRFSAVSLRLATLVRLAAGARLGAYRPKVSSRHAGYPLVKCREFPASFSTVTILVDSTSTSVVEIPGSQLVVTTGMDLELKLPWSTP
jgi:hypothetical protein